MVDERSSLNTRKATSKLGIWTLIITQEARGAKALKRRAVACSHYEAWRGI